MRRKAQARVDKALAPQTLAIPSVPMKTLTCTRHPAISKLVPLESGRGTTHHSPTAPTDSKGPFFLLWKSSEDVFELL